MRKPHPNARKLRKDMPEAEQRLWYFIRRKELGGFRFRRQHTIGPYIVDFACVESNLVIELDGDQHALGDTPERDGKRDAYLNQQGFEVLRFWNNEVYENIDGVLEVILDAAMNSARAKQADDSQQ